MDRSAAESAGNLPGRNSHSLGDFSIDPARELAQVRQQLASANEALRCATAERDAAVGQEAALQSELQHRVRNMLATIRSVFRRSIDTAGSLQEATDHFAGRLDTLARYQGLLMQRQGSAVDLEMLVRDELLTMGRDASAGAAIHGPTVLLRSKAAELMGLAVHELAINAMKFGAFSAGSGQVSIAWTAPTSTSGLCFEWCESGVPVVASAPLRRGFGREYIEDALPYELAAETSFVLRPGGLSCRIELSAEWLTS